MDADTRTFVRVRAGNHCEYCLIHQEHVEFPHHIEHIIAKQHGGDDSSDNLALACARCNAFKGPNLSGIDPDSGQLVPLFNPRHHEWAEHFAFQVADVRRVELIDQLGMDPLLEFFELSLAVAIADVRHGAGQSRHRWKSSVGNRRRLGTVDAPWPQTRTRKDSSRASGSPAE